MIDLMQFLHHPKRGFVHEKRQVKAGENQPSGRPGSQYGVAEERLLRARKLSFHDIIGLVGDVPELAQGEIVAQHFTGC